MFTSFVVGGKYLTLWASSLFSSTSSMPFSLFRYIPRISSANKLSLSSSLRTSSPLCRKLSPRSFLLAFIRCDFQSLLSGWRASQATPSCELQAPVIFYDYSYLTWKATRNIKNTTKSQSKAVTQQPNAWENDARVLERWLVELLQHFIVLLPNKEALLFESIRSQNGANKGQRFPRIVLFVTI